MLFLRKSAFKQSTGLLSALLKRMLLIFVSIQLAIGPAIHLVLAASIKLHPLGDSTTEAYELQSCWRYWLFKKLAANGFTETDFVGSRQGTNNGTTFSDNNWDMDHDGHTSSTAAQVLNGGLARDHTGSIKVWAPLYQPDIAVIYLGTNDIRQGRSTDATITVFKGIIDELRNARPSVKVIVCKIPYWTWSYGGSSAAVDALNAAIPSLASYGNVAQSPIKIVDLFTNYAIADHRDGIHPGQSGAQKICDRLYEAIVPWLSGTTQSINQSASGVLLQAAKSTTITHHPGSRTFTVHNLPLEAHSIHIMRPNGEVLYRTSVSTCVATLTLPGPAAGVFLLRVIGQGNSSSHRLCLY